MEDEIEATVRQAIVEYALWGVRNAAQIHYRELRPIDGIGHPHKLPLTTDCSGWATLCYNWSRAPDPNGNGYNGQGYTGTLLNHMSNISRAQAEPGDLVVFGPAPGEHVVVIVGTGGDPDVVSHGQEIGPIKVTLSAEARYHRAPLTFLRGRGVPAVAALVADSADGDGQHIVEQVRLPTDLKNATNEATDPDELESNPVD
jgi:hypothetical protein